MPSRLNAPVLTVDVALIHKVDTRNVENLFSMWTVFSRCASSLEEGRRLENLSWRLWNRETFCCDPVSEANATTPAISIASRNSEGRYSTDVPSLSGSLDSLSDEEAVEFESEICLSSTSAALDIHPSIQRHDSHSRSRGRERHITPDDLEKMSLFTLGGSSGEESVSEQADSVETNLRPLPPKKKAMFSFGGSSNEEESSLPRKVKQSAALAESRPLHQKVTSFQEEIATRTIQEESPFDDDVFETEDEDEIDESAIDDEDDSSDWEDSVEDSGNPSIDEKTFFQRKKKKGLNSIAEIPRSAAQPIIPTTTNTIPHQLALSPRTTRRNMLASELTVSLRQHLLWERKQKSQTANAVLKRRHTAQDVANLKQYPDQAYMDQEGSHQSTWNDYYGHGLGEYHSRGW
ncbi:DUF1752-domain-containing protein [Diplocarpon rosae]|nr:DUF1752-domain-containing protein [Diplocarpon rosae]